jgi:hypothetical protein
MEIERDKKMSLVFALRMQISLNLFGIMKNYILINH